VYFSTRPERGFIDHDESAWEKRVMTSHNATAKAGRLRGERGDDLRETGSQVLAKAIHGFEGKCIALLSHPAELCRRGRR
jgi:hypothetical protein